MIDLGEVDELNPSIEECAAMIDQADEYYWLIAANALMGKLRTLQENKDIIAKNYDLCLAELAGVIEDAKAQALQLGQCAKLLRYLTVAADSPPPNGLQSCIDRANEWLNANHVKEVDWDA